MSFCSSFSQINLTPNGVLDAIFDLQGNQYSLVDIMVNDQNMSESSKSILMNCSSTSYYNLYFETGCGMESLSDPIHIARRAVVCKVFQDLSNFINSPLTITGRKVNIWVRNINNLNGANPNGFLGFGTGFYQLPFNATNGGIADNEIWKTIHNGVDSFSNTTVPLTSDAGNDDGLFYHGMITFNFNDTATPPIPNTNPIIWNTSLTATSIPVSHFDLYTAVLHEAVHALGFSSLIDEDGSSKFRTNFNYYNRYDSFLKTNNGSNFLLTNNPSLGVMYNQSFNTSLNTNVLHPNTSNCIIDNTSCANAIKFYSSPVSSIPVYTPNCYEPASSLSHFEDMHFPACNSTAPTYGDDNYFLMCNAGNSGIIRRYLKPQERNALCSIGYSVKTTYGSPSTFQGVSPPNFYGSTVCGGISVAGLNDGITAAGIFAFSGIEGATIPINGILNNDYTSGQLSNLRFEQLQDLSIIPGFPTTLSTTFGSMGTVINFSSGLSGVHVLRYVPFNINTGQRGNITYVYVNIFPSTNLLCPPTATICNLVGNGDFEQNNLYLTQPNNNQFERACGWYRTGNIDTSSNQYQSPGGHYYLTNTVNPDFNVPCNMYGSELDKIAGNNGYAGILIREYNLNSLSSGVIGTTLMSSLAPNTTYNLSYDVSLADFVNHRYSQMSAFISSTPPSNILSWYIPDTILSTGILLNNPTYINTTNGWQTINFTFTTGSSVVNLNYLYIGALNTTQCINGSAPLTVASCVDNFTLLPAAGSFHYIDNVSLVAQLSITGPITLCIGDVDEYEANNSGGIWTTSDTSLADIDPISGKLTAYAAGAIDVIYTTTVGTCVTTATFQVTIIDSTTIPTFSFINTICSGATPPILPTISDNNIAGVWNPSIVTTSQTSTYQFIPSNTCTNPITYTVNVITSGNLLANDDTLYQPFSATSNSYNIKVNDTFNGNLLLSNSLNLNILITSNSYGISANQNGTLNIPQNLLVGNYTITYRLKNTCLASNTATVTIVVFNSTINPPVIISPARIGIETCFIPNGYRTLKSILKEVSVDGVFNDFSLLTISNVIAPTGFSINNDGRVNVPANALPGSYYLTYTLCPVGQFSGCVENIICQINIAKTVNANPDVFEFDIYGNKVPNPTATYRIVENDRFYPECETNSPSNGFQAFVFGNNSNVTFSSIDQSLLGGYFSINPSSGTVTPTGGIITPPSANTIGTGTYPFTYTICDNRIGYTDSCSTITSWINVIGYVNKVEDTKDNISILETVIVSPNPSNGIFTINFEKQVSTINIEVYSILGQKLFSKKSNTTRYLDIDVSNLASGTYLLKISVDGRIKSKLIIKK